MLHPSEFPRLLKKFRKNASMTQEDLAFELNMSQAHVSKYESGRKIVDLETFMNWVRITNSEAQAAMVMFGTDVCAQAAQLITLVPAYIMPLMAV